MGVLSSPGRVLALDVGSSSVRAILHDERARPVPGAEVHLSYSPRLEADGTAEVDVESLAGLVAQAVDRLLAGVDTSAIAGVGISSFWHGLLAAGPDRKPLTPLYLWNDTRSADFALALAGRVDGEAVRARTGCPVHSSYWPAKLLWLRQARPDLWRPEVRWLSFGDLLHWRLFGELGTSVSMASGTGLFLLAERCWDEELLGILEVSPDQVPQLRESVAGLLEPAASKWPALAGVPWFDARGDGALANLGSGCLDPSRRALTVGTSAALRIMHAGDPPRLPPGLWTYRLDAGRLVSGGALSNGGNLYAWLVHTLAVEREGLEERLERMRPAGHGLTFLPHLAGQRSLGYAPHATGAIAGLRSSTTAEEILRAGLEAVALDIAAVDQRLDQALPGARELVASGAGLLASPAWIRIMADAIGRRLVVTGAVEASSRGAAVSALERLGLARAEDLDPGSDQVYDPDPAAGSVYRAAQTRQERLHSLLYS